VRRGDKEAGECGGEADRRQRRSDRMAPPDGNCQHDNDRGRGNGQQRKKCD